MDVILLENVEGVGKRGDQVKVERGYARNYLLPRSLALEATSSGARQFQEKERVRVAQESKARVEAEKQASHLNKLTIHMKVQAGDDGKLFGSVTSADIAEAIAAEGHTVDKRDILLEEPLKELGVYHVRIKIFKEVEGKVRVLVTKV
ncbi:MAG: 50S ribosomal protein L9 [Candidatus Eisenbacteria bacterium]